MVTYKNPETEQTVKAQFTVSWMYDKQGLRLALDGIGAGYAFEMNTLRSPLEVFIGDAAATSVADAELALEKSQASRGLLAVQTNEADLYGYTDENDDAVAAFTQRRTPLLDWHYGVEIVRLTMAAYLSAERTATVDLTDPATARELETYVPLIQQGRGGEMLGTITGLRSFRPPGNQDRRRRNDCRTCRAELESRVSGATVTSRRLAARRVSTSDSRLVTDMTHERPEIEQWLADRGYPAGAIEKILERLDHYDSRINRESVFDAMEKGEFDMDALIKEALDDSK